MTNDIETLMTDGTLDLSRRRLLAAATCGLGLAVGCLSVPHWVAEAEARSGSNDGKLGGRHGRNHRGRDNHRDRGDSPKHNPDRDNNDPALQGSRSISFFVHNGRNVDFNFSMSINFPNEWHPYEEKTIKAGQTIEWPSDGRADGVQLNHNYNGQLTIQVINPDFNYPYVTFNGGPRTYMRVNQVAIGPGVEVKRLEDNDFYKRFQVDLF